MRRPSTSVEPLTADLNRIHVTASRRFLEKLAAARAALSRSHPGAGAEEILEAGLDLLLERAAKRKGLVAKPRREPPPSSPDHVPAGGGAAGLAGVRSEAESGGSQGKGVGRGRSRVEVRAGPGPGSISHIPPFA